MKITYSANNSGGGWWIDEAQWKALEAAGWAVEWREEFLGTRATEASKDFDSVEAAIQEFENTTGLDTSDQGCPCCGPPHNFYDW